MREAIAEALPLSGMSHGNREAQRETGACMNETDEGIGSRKWSFEPTAEGLFLNQGTYRLARIEPMKDVVESLKVRMLLVTAPQLWDAANELLKLLTAVGAPLGEASFQRDQAISILANMVAKSVGKTNYEDVLQRT